MNNYINEEYERKFLIQKLPNLEVKNTIFIEQKYLSGKDDKIVVRIRKSYQIIDGIKTNFKWYFTIKNKLNGKLMEFEKEINEDEFESYSKLNNLKFLTKKRITVHSIKNNFDYIIDIFSNELCGLIIAEVETITGEIERVNGFIAEEFFEKEITDNKKYSNKNLFYNKLNF
jgi:CYTH domain-containing protein